MTPLARYGAGRLPRVRAKLCHAAGLILGFVIGQLLSVRRDHVVASLKRAGIDDARRAAAAMYAALGRALFEMITLALSPRTVPRLTHPSEADVTLEEPCVVATAHTGNWDWLAVAAAQSAPLCVVTKHLSVGFLDRLWQRSRARRGVSQIAAGRAAREALRALGRGTRVAMLIDQAPERERATVVLPFLGADARVDLAPALIALRARVPLVVAFAHRLPDGSHAVDVVRRLVPPARADRRWAIEAMRLATADLEAFVRARPEQWLWMHRRWKDAPRPAAAACASSASDPIAIAPTRRAI